MRFYHLDFQVNVVFSAIINQFLGLRGASYNRRIIIHSIPVECQIVDGHLSSGRHTAPNKSGEKLLRISLRLIQGYCWLRTSDNPGQRFANFFGWCTSSLRLIPGA